MERGCSQFGAFYFVMSARRTYFPLLEYMMDSTNSNISSRHLLLDRFIPNRSLMDMDYARSMLTIGRMSKRQVNEALIPLSKVYYRELLAHEFNIEKNRMLVFGNKPLSAPPPPKPRRHINKNPVKVLDAPDVLDNYNLNLIDWGVEDTLALALGNTVYLWNASKGSVCKLLRVDDVEGPVTSVSWDPSSPRIAIGLESSRILVMDASTHKEITSFRGCHEARVGSLAWNCQIFTSGDMAGKIVNNDVRVGSHAVARYEGHRLEVCGLKWSMSGKHLASGGSDSLVYIWDKFKTSSIHKLQQHTGVVKALAWCPFKSNLLASGGGSEDGSIKLWDILNGIQLNSIHTGSAVSGLLWNKNQPELLSSHGSSSNCLMLWNYPRMTKLAELSGHTDRVHCISQSPNECCVVSLGTDETLRFWNVFGSPTAAKRAAKIRREPFDHISRIRLLYPPFKEDSLEAKVIKYSMKKHHRGYHGVSNESDCIGMWWCD